MLHCYQNTIRQANLFSYAACTFVFIEHPCVEPMVLGNLFAMTPIVSVAKYSLARFSTLFLAEQRNIRQEIYVTRIPIINTYNLR